MRLPIQFSRSKVRSNGHAKPSGHPLCVAVIAIDCYCPAHLLSMRLSYLLNVSVFLLMSVVVYSRESIPSNLDPYATLRVSRDATSDAIRAAYRVALNVMGRAASKHGHGQEPHAEDMALLASIGLSYKVLIDKGWRSEWDAAHFVPTDHQPTPFPLWDKMEDL